MTKRKRSRSANSVLQEKPNQFPRARFSNIRWNRYCDVVNKEAKEDTDGDEESTTETGRSRDELKHRFDEPACGCPEKPKK